MEKSPNTLRSVLRSANRVSEEPACSNNVQKKTLKTMRIIAAVIILILAFGSVLAMGLPIGTALFGLGIATALVTLASNFLAMPDFARATRSPSWPRPCSTI